MYERKPKMLTVPVTVGAANGFKVRPYLSSESDSNLSGNEVYHTNYINVLVKKMLNSKLHCQKGSDPGPRGLAFSVCLTNFGAPRMLSSRKLTGLYQKPILST